MKQTPFYEQHVQFKARLTDFAGYSMPVFYDSINSEHLHVRKKVGVFDVSHMGEFLVRGPDAVEFVDLMTVNNVSRLAVNQAQYSAMCFDDGGIVDDLLVYRFEDHLLLVVNGANRVKDFDWLTAHLPAEGVELTDISDEIALLAVQGPDSVALLQELTDQNLDEIGFYWFREGKLAEEEMIISRTGYTGEPGFELYIPADRATLVWERLFAAGERYDLKPVGLGARDSLRLEMKYCLYGNDIDETTTPLEAGLGWITRMKKKANFVGRDALKHQREQGIPRRLIGFRLLGKGVPRHGYRLMLDGEAVGEVTSGIMSPVLKEPIGLGYLPAEHAEVGTEFQMEVRGKLIPAVVVETPFVHRGD